MLSSTSPFVFMYVEVPMAYEVYTSYKPGKEAALLLRTITDIVILYQGQGLRLTLRQLYYQLVARDIIPNKEASYKKIGNLVSKARLGGFLDWDAIEDRVRQPKSPPEFGSLDELINAALHSFRLPRLKGQERYVELWVEKDALAGVLHPIAYENHIVLMVNRGYSSTSAMRESALRIREKTAELGVDEAVVLYLGDLDPSGEDMVRDIEDRLNLFLLQGLEVDWGGHPFKGNKPDIEDYDASCARRGHVDLKVKKLALTMDQVEEYDPPPNPAKLTDSRASKYVEEFGEHSWEVDALPPETLRSIIEEELDELIDHEAVEKVTDTEDEQRALLRQAVSSLQNKGGDEGPKPKARRRKR